MDEAQKEAIRGALVELISRVPVPNQDEAVLLVHAWAEEQRAKLAIQEKRSEDE